MFRTRFRSRIGMYTFRVRFEKKIFLLASVIFVKTLVFPFRAILREHSLSVHFSLDHMTKASHDPFTFPYTISLLSLQLFSSSYLTSPHPLHLTLFALPTLKKSHLTIPQLISPTPHLISQHVISYHLTSAHLTSSRLTLPYLTSSQNISLHLTSTHDCRLDSSAPTTTSASERRGFDC